MDLQSVLWHKKTPIHLSLDECKAISDEHCHRFDQILKEHAEWKEPRNRLVTACSRTPESFDS